MATTSARTTKPARKAATPAKKAPAKRAAPAKPARQAAATAATPAKAKKVRAPAKRTPVVTAPERVKVKHKLVRDSFTMPQPDFDLIATLKKRVMALGHSAKKSELLRAGLHALTKLDDAALHGSLQSLIQLKAGRPRKQS